MARIVTTRSSDQAFPTTFLLFLIPLLLSSAGATSFNRHDGLHRVDKKPQITAPAVLGLARRDDKVCGTGLSLCPSSLGGDCCPENYDCAKESCYATTKGPSTCGTKVGWYACAAVYGGGCCPDGYLCERAANCVPPSGSPYTFGCPASHYLCPASASYGCCPNGMGCAVDQCYSTAPTAVTKTMVITSTASGSAIVYTTTATTVDTPLPPTSFPAVGSGDDAQKVLKYFPSAVAKVMATVEPNGGGGGGGISGGKLGGIIGGSVSFVIIALVAGFLLCRRRGAQRRRTSITTKGTGAESSRRLGDMKARAQMIEVHALDSDADTRSADPLMMASPPPPSHQRSSPALDSMFGGSPELAGSAYGTPSSFGGEFQSVNGTASRHASVDPEGARFGYFDALPALSREQQSAMGRAVSRMSQNSRPGYSHVRQWSDASSASSGPDAGPPALVAELEAQPYVAELPSAVSPADERQRTGAGGGAWTPSSSGRPPQVHRRERSDGRTTTARLDVVDEELIHGYHGPTDRVVGQTSAQRRERRQEWG